VARRSLVVADADPMYVNWLRRRYTRIRRVIIETEEFRRGVGSEERVVASIKTVVVYWGRTWADEDTRCTRFRPDRLRRLRSSQRFSTTDVEDPGARTAVSGPTTITIRGTTHPLRVPAFGRRR